MQNASVWTENVRIPTYEIGEAEKNPVFLENEYLRVMVLPELGGRIQRAYDKTNGYDFVYYNHVIKPALVGLTGPWISGVYYKMDYSEGVDISRYKNIPVPTSYMAEKSKYDFVGGYDYGRDAGILHVADHHISPGKKQWTWGCGDFGKAWDRNLTDEDRPYVELMTGVFTDNQPDFTWLKPFEEKVFRQYFMPYKALGQVKNATTEAAAALSYDGETSMPPASAEEPGWSLWRRGSWSIRRRRRSARYRSMRRRCRAKA